MQTFIFFKWQTRFFVCICIRKNSQCADMQIMSICVVAQDCQCVRSRIHSDSLQVPGAFFSESLLDCGSEFALSGTRKFAVSADQTARAGNGERSTCLTPHPLLDMRHPATIMCASVGLTACISPITGHRIVSDCFLVFTQAIVICVVSNIPF